MKRTHMIVAIVILAALSAIGLANAASGEIEGWHITYEDMNCIADGVALDPEDNRVWKVRLVHFGQNQLNLVAGLYNKEVAEMYKGKEINTSARFSLYIGEVEFQSNESFFDKDGELVLDIDNSNTLQNQITENTTFSVILHSNEGKKFRLSTLQVSNAKKAFEWLRLCSVFGVSSIKMR